MKQLKTKQVLRKSMKYAFALSLVASSFLPGAGFTDKIHAESHVDNPYQGATKYVSPDYAASVDTSIAKITDANLKAKMQTVKTFPTAVWLDRIAAINGGGGRLGLEAHLDQVLAQKKGSTPITAEFIVYDLPGRDCKALASNGELPLTQAGLETYKKDYVDKIAAIFANPKYQDIRIVAIIEPDSLPNLVTNLDTPQCAQAKSTGIYEAGIKYTMNKLNEIPNVYKYVDIGHSGWLGWDNNRSATVSLFTTIFKDTSKGLSSVDGFISNTANTSPLTEPNLPNPDLNIGGQPIKSSKFYEWNPNFDELHFTESLYKDFVNAGWPSSLGMLIDTSRNGWGGPNRPTSAVGSDINSYVNSGRVDKRAHRGNWCNSSGAGMGTPPQTAPAGHIDAYVWAKPPGDSDGSSSLIPNDEGKGFDRMCDPTYTTKDGTLTDALPNAPISGAWFHDQFVMLVQNAYPAIVPSTGGVDPAPTAPAVPSGLKAVAGNAQVTLTWNASTGADSYTVKRATSEAGPFTAVAPLVTAREYTDKGLTNGTTYFYVVSATNAKGTSKDSATVSAEPKGTPTDPTDPTEPAGDLVVMYRAGDTDPANNAAKPFFNLKNKGTTPVKLSELKVRYYFTKDGSQELQSAVDWAQVGNDNVLRTIKDNYIEIGFSAAAGTLAAGAQTGDIQIRMNNSDWSNLNESNDYSFDPTKTSYAEWNKVTLFHNDKLVWGIEP
ncbi:Exoglucanase A [Paenibacillus polymyxa E681]|uniref:glycoside hydrolase family 6 protein n=2 Tax=Paenibacillus polymyxa TaxID=1406 RepID=UPI0009B9A270|nr:glycoside hydrolase family 6 protein [Paenibacillus polymyxa]ADM68848.2 exocellobiohydrolase [Paenibacillus polymyxa E681]QNV55853.1 Exoglucanase A [Paenibacillus polymyxa E681]QNV60689.1 Exoglucanase A [Paenibacillus polymyxa E681]